MNNDALIEKLTDEVIKRLPQVLPIPVEASGRHVHLSQEDVEKLFGPGHRLTFKRELSQPGQFLCEERVSLKGAKGELKNVAVLGPARKRTQIELSKTDSAAIGAEAPVRESGDTAGSAPLSISANGVTIGVAEGGIVALRHLHVTPRDARLLGVHDGERISVRVNGARPAILEETLVREGENYSTTIHLDFDEANACGYSKGVTANLVAISEDSQR